MKARKMNFSTHITNDRLDRMTYIAMTIGFGEVAYTFPCKGYQDRYVILTTTGVLMVKTRSEMVVTVFIPEYKRVHALFAEMEMEVPRYYRNIIEKNQKHNRMQDIVKY